MNVGITLSTILFVISVVLGLIQLWFAPWSHELYAKLEMTCIALLITVLVVSFVRKEQREDRINRSGDKLDDSK